jgi:hypothetical protein
MKGMLFAAVFAACALAVPAQADTTATPAKKPLTAQQQKMKDCNAEAKTKALKGADRKAFMKTCLSGSNAAPAADAAAPAATAAPAAAAPAATAAPAAAAPAADATAAAAPKVSQKQKMKDCNAQATAKTLKGADRKAFMSTCLKG